MSGPTRRDAVDDFLDDLGRIEPPSKIADAVMVRVRAVGSPRRRTIWWPAAAAILLVALGAGVVSIGTRPPDPRPSPSLEPSPDATPAPTVFVRTYDGISCPLAGLPPGPITFRIDLDAPWPDQVVAIDRDGHAHALFWAEGFTGGTLADPVVRDPAGEVVARDGEQFRLTPDDDRLHGYRVCSGSDNLYIPLFGREDPNSTPSPPPATDLGLLPGSWIAIPDAPIPGRQGHTAIWTGTEMIVWGGEPGPASPDDDVLIASNIGAAYDPVADTWRVLPQAPLEGRTLHSAVWTGAEMVVFGGISTRPGSRPLGDGAAYDPATNRWRPLPPPPFDASGTQVMIWAHDELVVVDGAIVTDAIFHLDVAAYRPETDNWAILPPLEAPGVQAYSVAFTGSSLQVVALLATTNGSAAYVLSRPPDAWRRLPDPPRLRIVGGGPEVFTGTEIIVPATIEGVDVVAAFDTATEHWRVATPPLGLGAGGNTWTGTLAFFGLGTGGMERRTVYDPTRDAWFGVPEAAGIHREAATHVWAGDRLIVWGGFEGESFFRPTGGSAFVPARYAVAAKEFEGAGSDLLVELADASGTVTGIRAPSRDELEAVDTLQVDERGTLLWQLGDRAVLVYWLGGPGDKSARIEVAADGRALDLVAVPTYGDAIPFARAIVLEFDHDVAVDDLDLVFWSGRP